MRNKRLLSLGSDKKHGVTRIQKRTKGVSWSVAIGRYCGEWRVFVEMESGS